jgi:hypothetical protein
VTERRGSHPNAPAGDLPVGAFRAANAVTFVINGALGGFAFVFSDGVIGILITIMPWRFP